MINEKLSRASLVDNGSSTGSNQSTPGGNSRSIPFTVPKYMNRTSPDPTQQQLQPTTPNRKSSLISDSASFVSASFGAAAATGGGTNTTLNDNSKVKIRTFDYTGMQLPLIGNTLITCVIGIRHWHHGMCQRHALRAYVNEIGHWHTLITYVNDMLQWHIRHWHTLVHWAPEQLNIKAVTEPCKFIGCVVVTAYDFESALPGSNPEWGPIYYKASITVQGLPEPSSLQGSTLGTRAAEHEGCNWGMQIDW